MNSVLTAPEEIREYDDPSEFLDTVTTEYTEYDALAPVNESWFPSEYVVFYTGPRGSSKTLQLARHSLLGLAQGLKVFTNLELYPDKIGIETMPNPVNLEFLLSFDESLTDAVIVISEIDTWWDRMRETSTSNRLGSKFLQQLRKKGLRIFFDTQDYLPGGLMRQVDKLVYCHDFFWTEWGKEHQIRKGTTFYYDCMDYSGIFTGHRGRIWQEALHHAEKVWPLFNTNKIHDPMEFARKVRVVGGEMEYDRDTKKLYDVSEKEQRTWEHDQAGYSAEAKPVEDVLEGSGFLELARNFRAVREFKSPLFNKGGILRFTDAKLSQMIAAVEGEGKLVVQSIVDDLRTRAMQGKIARFHPSSRYIEFHRHVPEANDVA